MITIYHVPNSRSLRIVWLMEELGEDYTVERVSIPLSPEFLTENPHGMVPSIKDGDIRMGESLAILQYLTGVRLVAGDAKAAALTVGPLPDPAAYAEHLHFLHLGEASLAAPLSAIFRTVVRHKLPADETVKDQLERVAKQLRFCDDHLSDGRIWITGSDFTIADISLGYAFNLMKLIGIEDQLPENVAAYWQRLKARPAFERTMAV